MYSGRGSQITAPGELRVQRIDDTGQVRVLMRSLPEDGYEIRWQQLDMHPKEARHVARMLRRAASGGHWWVRGGVKIEPNP